MIVTVARDEGLRLRVAEALRDTRWMGAVTTVASVGDARQFLTGTSVPNAIVVGPAIGLSGAAEIVDAASALRRPPPVLLVADPTTEVLRGAMRAGVRDVLPPSFSAEDLVRAFEDAGVSSGGPPAKPGLTVAVFSTKGGVGTSVIASNLAVRLAAHTGARSTLVDLDLASADQAIMHGLSPKWTIQDLADGSVAMDAESLRQVLLDVPGAAARLLPGPLDPALAETITSANVASVVGAARAEAALAVLDTASSFDDRTLAALDTADSVVITSSLDVAALRSLTVTLHTLERLGVTKEQITVAVSRADSKSGLTVGDVERAIDRQVDVGIPSTRAVPRSINEGVPLAVSSPRSDVVSAIDELVALVMRHASPDFAGPESDADPDEETARGGLFPWSRGSRKRGTDDHTATRPVERGESPSQSVPDSAAGPETPSAEGEDQPADEPAEVVELRTERGARSAPRRVHRAPRASDPARTPQGGLTRSGAEDDEDVPRDESEPSAPPPLAAMPPPTIVVDDEDDQPRRQRRS